MDVVQPKDALDGWRDIVNVRNCDGGFQSFFLYSVSLLLLVGLRWPFLFVADESLLDELAGVPI